MADLNPDSVARAARRLAAKMVADQAEESMASFLGLHGDPSTALSRALESGEAVMVIVARGRHVAHYLSCVDGVSSAEVEDISPAHDD